MDVTLREESTVGIHPPQAPIESRAAVSSLSWNESVDALGGREGTSCTSFVSFLCELVLFGGVIAMVITIVCVVGKSIPRT